MENWKNLVSVKNLANFLKLKLIISVHSTRKTLLESKLNSSKLTLYNLERSEIIDELEQVLWKLLAYDSCKMFHQCQIKV